MLCAAVWARAITWEVRDLMVPGCTPFELEVALGAREWTGEYITDLEELLQTAPMSELISQTSDEGPTVVQTLGATKIRSFEKSRVPAHTQNSSSQEDRVKPPPASITPGLHGVPWKYSQEESFQKWFWPFLILGQIFCSMAGGTVPEKNGRADRRNLVPQILRCTVVF